MAVEIYKKEAEKPKYVDNSTHQTINVHPKLAKIPIGNIPPLTEAYIRKRLNTDLEYTYDMFTGRKLGGVVDLIKQMVVLENDLGEKEQNYACTDTSRHRFHRLKGSKTWTKDPGGNYLQEILGIKELRDKIKKFSQQARDEMSEYVTEATKAKEISRFMIDYHSERVRGSQFLYNAFFDEKSADREKFFVFARQQLKDWVSV